jgi:hypothetical protein
MLLGHPQHWADAQGDVSYSDIDDLTLNVEPGERIGPPLPSPYKAMLRRIVLVGVLCGAGWTIATDEGGPDSLVSQARALIETAVASAQRFAAQSKEGPADQQGVPDGTGTALALAGQPATQANAVELPPVLMQMPVEATEPERAEAPPAASIGTAYSEKAEAADDKSPERKRAMAAGLGANLPNVLLTRLNKGDLENAAYAIKTAIAKTPDDGLFAWPPSPARHQASFEVRFVQGAAEGCRRYVVKVTKERWSSTSAALEKCVSGAPRAG